MSDPAEIKRKNVYLAKLAEQAERYDEMKECMRIAASCEADCELTVEERNLLSVAYKNAVGSRRASWRIVSSVEQKEHSKKNTQNAELAREYREQVEKELNAICEEILDLLKKHLIKDSTPGEGKVFYYKMQGDYCRYIAEFSDGEGKKKSADNAKMAYDEAMEVAKDQLPVTHPIRLGLALNFSVFHYEVLSTPDTACKMARDAFEDAIAELDNVSEEQYKDSTLIMQLLRDNLTLWTSDQDQDQEQDLAGRENQ